MQKLRSPLTLREAVAEGLRTSIVAGDLEPGALLKETELAMWLGVSATPVREALAELAAEGLVEIETHRLKRVTPLDPAAMLDLVRVQGALWRMGYVWGFPRIGEAELAQLDAAIAAYQAALNENDILAAIRAGHDFHTVFITASGNRELLRVTLDRRALIARFILLCGSETISRSGLQQHRSILRAFRRGDTADVLARLDQLAARLIAMAQNLVADGSG
ncbi:MAG: GntR family transcriptional regulator [Rhizorhabdus sp.]|nr:GntR family transcriptional regulator [Rhizorhabdus sp.]